MRQVTQGDLQIAQLACRSFGALDTSYLVVILHLALMAMAASIMLPKARVVNGKEGGKEEGGKEEGGKVNGKVNGKLNGQNGKVNGQNGKVNGKLATVAIRD